MWAGGSGGGAQAAIPPPATLSRGLGMAGHRPRRPPHPPCRAQRPPLPRSPYGSQSGPVDTRYAKFDPELFWQGVVVLGVDEDYTGSITLVTSWADIQQRVGPERVRRLFKKRSQGKVSRRPRGARTALRWGTPSAYPPPPPTPRVLLNNSASPAGV